MGKLKGMGRSHTSFFTNYQLSSCILLKIQLPLRLFLDAAKEQFLTHMKPAELPASLM